jgi:hypothetical protein
VELNPKLFLWRFDGEEGVPFLCGKLRFKTFEGKILNDA